MVTKLKQTPKLPSPLTPLPSSIPGLFHSSPLHSNLQPLPAHAHLADGLDSYFSKKTETKRRSLPRVPSTTSVQLCACTCPYILPSLSPTRDKLFLPQQRPALPPCMYMTLYLLSPAQGFDSTMLSSISPASPVFFLSSGTFPAAHKRVISPIFKTPTSELCTWGFLFLPPFFLELTPIRLSPQKLHLLRSPVTPMVTSPWSILHPHPFRLSSI